MDVTSESSFRQDSPENIRPEGTTHWTMPLRVYVEAILMPVGTAEGITVNVHVDGRDFTYALPLPMCGIPA